MLKQFKLFILLIACVAISAPMALANSVCPGDPSIETEIGPDKKYKFAKSYTYTMSVADAAGEQQNVDLELLVPNKDEPKYIAIRINDQGFDGHIVFDHELDAMVMLMKDKTGTMMTFDMLKQFNPMTQGQATTEVSDVTMEKTGKNGTHMGYNYEEVAIKSTDGEGVVWMSSDKSFNLFKLFEDFGGMGGQSTMMAQDQFKEMEGLLLKAVMKDKSGQTSTMTLTDSKDLETEINLADYQIMDMSSMMQQK